MVIYLSDKQHMLIRVVKSRLSFKSQDFVRRRKCRPHAFVIFNCSQTTVRHESPKWIVSLLQENRVFIVWNCVYGLRVKPECKVFIFSSWLGQGQESNLVTTIPIFSWSDAELVGNPASWRWVGRKPCQPDAWKYYDSSTNVIK